jgi:molecular chaperone GrpE
VAEGEPGEPGGAAGGLEAPTVENLEKALAAAEVEIEVQREEALRAHAELENFRRRSQRDLETGLKFALDRFLLELLPVLDSLEMGLSAAQDVTDDQTAEKLREGTQLTLKQALQLLAKHGVQQINPVGEQFDPEFHEAATLQPSEEHPPNTVTTVIQKGYSLHGRLIRPAMVIVAQAPKND